MMHAENGMAIDVVAAQTVEAGTTDPIGHGLARKAIFEGEATNRVIRLAEAAGVPVYIVHLSAREALAEVRAARDRGAKAFAETCPQYLFLSLDDLGNGFEGAKFVCSPPLRTKDHWDDLWTGLVTDDLQLVVDRPLPVRLPRPEGARQGRLPQDPERPARASRTGSTCSTTAASWAAGSRRERWVEIVSTAPAKLFGMYPQQGRGRRRLGRRPRRLRPGPQAHDLGHDPPHGRRLLVLRGPDRPGRQRRRPVRAARSSSATASSPAGRATARFIKRAPADHARLGLTGRGRRGRRPDRRPRRRARDRARGARPRPVRPALVGASAADRSGRDRGRPSRLLPGRRDGRHDGQLPGDGRRASRRPGSTGRPPLGAIRDSVDARPACPRPVRGGGRRRRHGPARRRVRRTVRRDAGRRLRVPRRLRPGRRPPSARSTRRGSRRCSTPASTCSHSRRSRPSARRRSWSACSTTFDARAWLSYSCRDGSSTSAGEPIETAIALGEAPGIVAVGINCTAPRFLPDLLARRARRHDPPAHRLPERRRSVGCAGPALAGGRRRRVRSGRRRRRGRPSGATWLGGCCGTGPADIARLAARLARGRRRARNRWCAAAP